MITFEDIYTVPLFATLSEERIRRIAARAADIRLRAGDWAAREGDTGAFFVLLEGELEATKAYYGRQQRLAVRGPGDFFGEVPLLLGAPFVAGFRATAPSHLLRLSHGDFATLLCTVDAVRDQLTTALFQRVTGVEQATMAIGRPPLVVGTRFDLACHTLRDFLERNFVGSEWLDPTNEEEKAWIPAVAQGSATLPLLVLPDDTVIHQPSLRAVAQAVGLQTVPSEALYDVVIIGGGPSGLSAAVYGASEGLHTLMIEGTAPGGQAGTSSRIENYLGFPIGIAGDDLGSRALTQAQRFGAEIVVTRQVCAITPGDTTHTLLLEDGLTIGARTVVLAMGVSYRSLEVPGLDRLLGAGVYYGASRTEAIGTRGWDLYLVGGGNSAGQSALFFSNYAAHVTLLVRGPSLAASMSQYLIDQLATRDNIAVRTGTVLTGVVGDNHLEAITIRDQSLKAEERLLADGVFIFIGADAHTEWLSPALARDPLGYILTGRDIDVSMRSPLLDRDRFLLETSVPGIFAAGDVRHGSMKRVAAAVGEGSMAIAFIHQHLAALQAKTREDP